MTVFSDVGLRALPFPEKGQKVYWDNIPGFGLRVSKHSKTFVLKHRNRWITIGRFPVPMTLSGARAAAKTLLAEFTLGRIRPQSIIYTEAVKLFLDDKAKSRRGRTVRDYERLLGRVSFGQLAEIDHNAIGRALKPFTAPSEYNHILVALKVFLSWCRKRRYIEHNPAEGFSQHTVHSRSRVLTDDEIRAIHEACTDHPSTFSSILLLLLYTGQRRGEIAALQSSWIHDNTVTFPSTATKNGREHVLPMGALASTLVAEQFKSLGHPNSGTSQLLFPSSKNSSKQINSWSKASAALWKITGIEGATLHDIRRTYATKMADLGIAPHIIERLLNHISGQISGVASIYNRAKYLEEMRDAVERYETWLSNITKI